MRVKLNLYDVVNLIVFAAFIVGCVYLSDPRKFSPQVWWISWSLFALVLSFFGVVMYRGFQQAERKLTVKEQELIDRKGTLKKGQAILLAEFSKEKLQELLEKSIIKVGECETSEMPSHDVSVRKEALLMLIETIRTQLKRREGEGNCVGVWFEE